MQIKLEEFSARFAHRGKPVPREYAGQWVAWDEDCTEILSHGQDMREVRNQAIASGCVRPVLQRIPRGPFVGGA
jgi:hypothetical protein